MSEQIDLTTDESFGSCVRPQSLSSAQYIYTLRRRIFLEPEKRLMLAILEDAVQCFQNNGFAQSVRGRRIFQEAKKWIVDADRDWVFSFENVCEALGLNPAYVRAGLRRMVIPPLGTEGRLLNESTWKKRETNESSALKGRRFRGKVVGVGPEGRS
jgi:hypothetical protein